jgi:hypothetical protein
LLLMVSVAFAIHVSGAAAKTGHSARPPCGFARSRADMHQSVAGTDRDGQWCKCHAKRAPPLDADALSIFRSRTEIGMALASCNAI